MLLVLYLLLKTSMTDPGIIPRREKKTAAVKFDLEKADNPNSEIGGFLMGSHRADIDPNAA